MGSRKPPIFLNLTEISLPVTGLVSILHRVTGVIMILSLPLWLVIISGFIWSGWGENLFGLISDFFLVKLALLLASSAWWCHIIAGFRHLYHDLSGDHSLSAMRFSAKIVLFLSVVMFGVIGWGVWR